MIKIIGVETNNGIYITSFATNPHYLYQSLQGYIVNGSKTNPSHEINWVITKNIPTKLQKHVRRPDINERWELKDESLKSDKMPLTLTKEQLSRQYEDESYQYFGEFESVGLMYSFKSDKQDDALEDVEFEYEKVCSIEEIKGGTQKYTTHGKIQHQLVDKMLYPSVVLSEKPCSFSPEATYKIIRSFIKNGINPKFAEITSDYDFCFTVKKKIELAEPESYSVDVNQSLFSRRKRKAKYETRYRKSRNIPVFEMAPKPYQSYTVINGFAGKNHTDLEEKVTAYCEELIKIINEPLDDCPICKGAGVTLNQGIK